jgi:hypothetical protein
MCLKNKKIEWDYGDENISSPSIYSCDEMNIASRLVVEK